ncbi:MAG: CbtB-domain containing protein [Nitriliruptorales bacterium]|nr:CbtB-domain containing protein [Nitriliruptorales bacterium]
MPMVVASADVERRRAAVWMLLLAAVTFLVTFDQGALTTGQPLFHELFHDGRHLLGVPCH